MKKNIKDGSLYYRQKDILRPIGAVLLPLGLVVIYLGFGYLAYIFGSIAVPAGLVLFIIGGSKHISDNDVAEQIEHAMLDYDRGVTDMTGYDRVVLKQPAPVEISAYSFGPDAKFYKKGKNGTVISDRLTRTHIFYTKDTLMIVGRTLSVTDLSDGGGVTDFSEHIALSGVRSAALEEHVSTVNLSTTGKETTVKWYELVLMGAEEELLRIPAKNDMDATGLVDDINHRCGK